MGHATQVRIDVRIARGLDYYTGTVFETNLIQGDGTLNVALGSICSGGRYDDLAEIFTGKKLPGVGISIGLTRLLFQLFDAGIVEAQKISPSDFLVIMQDKKYLDSALTVAARIRKEGYKVEVYLEDKKIGKQFEYADKVGIYRCIVIGEDEVRDKTVVIKDLRMGTQKIVAQKDLEGYLL
jgi:histidyl-tRNA synthetase